MIRKRRTHLRSRRLWIRRIATECRNKPTFHFLPLRMSPNRSQSMELRRRSRSRIQMHLERSRNLDMDNNLRNVSNILVSIIKPSAFRNLPKRNFGHGEQICVSRRCCRWRHDDVRRIKVLNRLHQITHELVHTTPSKTPLTAEAAVTAPPSESAKTPTPKGPPSSRHPSPTFEPPTKRHLPVTFGDCWYVPSPCRMSLLCPKSRPVPLAAVTF